MTEGCETDPAPARDLGYHHVLARLRLGRKLRGPLDSSDLVQKTLLRARQAEYQAGREAWSRIRSLLQEADATHNLMREGGARGDRP
jgi:hypothetical protein